MDAYIYTLRPASSLRIADVKDIDSVGKTIYIVRGESLWRLSPGEPKNLKIPAYTLIRKGTLLGVIDSRDSVLLNDSGAIVARYAVPPWSIRVLDFPDLHAALYFQLTEGRITLLDRNTSLIDIPTQSKELKEWLMNVKDDKENQKIKINLNTLQKRNAPKKLPKSV